MKRELLCGGGPWKTDSGNYISWAEALLHASVSAADTNKCVLNVSQPSRQTFTPESIENVSPKSHYFIFHSASVPLTHTNTQPAAPGCHSKGHWACSVAVIVHALTPVAESFIATGSMLVTWDTHTHVAAHSAHYVQFLTRRRCARTSARTQRRGWVRHNEREIESFRRNWWGFGD